MPSYRDRRYPEVLHFPGEMRVKVMIVCGLFVCVLSAGVSAITLASVGSKVLDGVLLALACMFLVRTWPQELVLDEHGIHSRAVPGRPHCTIHWKDVAEARVGHEKGGRLAAALGLNTETLVILSKHDSSRIVHTPRHPDRKRLILELKQHGIAVNAPARETAPSH